MWCFIQKCPINSYSLKPISIEQHYYRTVITSLLDQHQTDGKLLTVQYLTNVILFALYILILNLAVLVLNTCAQARTINTTIVHEP